MKIILTGPQGNLGYWDASARIVGKHAFGFKGHFKNEGQRAFARLSKFAGNSNHAPKGYEAAITSDLGLDLLHSIAQAQ
ncbi:MAG: hypothetical protein WA790_12005 [Sulfitobacter sp.]